MHLYRCLLGGVLLSGGMTTVLAAALVHTPELTKTSHPIDAPHLQSSISRQSWIEPNVGQWDSHVRYAVRAPGYRAFITDHGLATAVRNPKSRQVDFVEMSFTGAKAAAGTGTGEPGPTRVSYLTGSDPSRWRTNIPTYRRVSLDNVYPGIDVVYRATGRGLEYDFHVRPGGDPHRIQLAYSGTVGLDRDGNLRAQTGQGTFVHHRPRVYQMEQDGREVEIDARFALNGSLARFELAGFDRSRTLVVDPEITFSTLIGGGSFVLGSETEYAFGTAIAPDGSVWIAGTSDQFDYPATTTPFPYDTNNADVVVSHFDPTGTTLLYSTYLGGSGLDRALSIKLDAQQNIYLTGITGSTDFPVTGGAYVHRGGDACGDVFVSKINPQGSAFVYSSQFGGTACEFTSAMTVLPDGTVAVTGQTNSTSFPVTPGAFQAVYGGGFHDAYVSRLSADGSQLLGSTFFGGSLEDDGYGIASDSAGNIVLAGATQSSDLPVTSGAYQTTYGGGVYDGFVARFPPNLGSLLGSTYIGGRQTDTFNAVAVDGAGAIYVTGWAERNYPTTRGAYSRVMAGEQDVVVSKLNPSLTALLFSTYLGGAVYDMATGIALDGSGGVWVAGYTTNGAAYPHVGTLTPAVSAGGAYDVLVSHLNSTGSTLLFSTAFGGTCQDFAFGLAAGGDGSVAVSGNTCSRSGFPLTPGAYDTSLLGTFDAFVMKIKP